MFGIENPDELREGSYANGYLILVKISNTNQYRFIMRQFHESVAVSEGLRNAVKATAEKLVKANRGYTLDGDYLEPELDEEYAKQFFKYVAGIPEKESDLVSQVLPPQQEQDSKQSFASVMQSTHHYSDRGKEARDSEEEETDKPTLKDEFEEVFVSSKYQAALHSSENLIKFYNEQRDKPRDIYAVIDKAISRISADELKRKPRAILPLLYIQQPFLFNEVLEKFQGILASTNSPIVFLSLAEAIEQLKPENISNQTPLLGLLQEAIKALDKAHAEDANTFQMYCILVFCSTLLELMHEIHFSGFKKSQKNTDYRILKESGFKAMRENTVHPDVAFLGSLSLQYLLAIQSNEPAKDRRYRRIRPAARAAAHLAAAGGLLATAPLTAGVSVFPALLQIRLAIPEIKKATHTKKKQGKWLAALSDVLESLETAQCEGNWEATLKQLAKTEMAETLNSDATIRVLDALLSYYPRVSEADQKAILSVFKNYYAFWLQKYHHTLSASTGKKVVDKVNLKKQDRHGLKRKRRRVLQKIVNNVLTLSQANARNEKAGKSDGNAQLVVIRAALQALGIKHKEPALYDELEAACEQLLQRLSDGLYPPGWQEPHPEFIEAAWRDTFTGDLTLDEAYQTYQKQLSKIPKATTQEETSQIKRAAKLALLQRINKLLNSKETLSEFGYRQANQLREDIEQHMQLALQHLSRDKLCLQRISDKKAMPLHEKYVNVAIIKEEEQRQKDNALQLGERGKDKSDTEKQTSLSHLPPSFEALRQVKEPVELSSLYAADAESKKQMQHQTQHLILGRAGVGKTTLCQYIVAKHARGELWNDQFKWVFWVPLRLLQSYAKGKKVKLWKALYESSWKRLGLTRKEAESFWQLIEKESKAGKVLWLLDGYDEIAGVAQDEGMKQLLATLTKTPCHIVTSRPYGVGQLKYSSRLESIGFTDEAIDEYVTHYFDDAERAKEMQVRLEHNPRLRSLMSIPINADLICGLYQGNAGKAVIDPATLSMTGLYESLVETLLLRSPEGKREEEAREEVAKPQLLVSMKAEPDVVNFLAQLAWDNLNDSENTIVITEKQVRCVLEKAKGYRDTQLLDKVFDSGLLKSIGTVHDNTQLHHPLAYSGDCYFIHLTFQDFFAAQYVVSVLTTEDKVKKAEIEQAIRHHKYNPYYYFVWAFVAGLLKDYPETLNHFFTLLLAPPRDAVGFYELGLLMHCLEECIKTTDFDRQLQDGIEQLPEIGKLLLDATQQWLLTSLYDYELSNHFMTQLQLVPHLRRSGFLHHFILSYSAENPSLCIDELYALRDLGWPSDEGMQRRCFEVVLKACGDADSNVLHDALSALGSLGWPSDEGMQRRCVEVVLKACEDADWGVRHAALSALVRLGWSSDEGMQRRCVEVMLKACGDADSFVRRDTLSALVRLDWPSDEGMQRRCVEVMLKACEDADSDVRRGALSALGSLGWPSDEGMQRGCFEVVLKACEDADSDVRRGALSALGSLGWPSDEGMQRGCFEVVLKACEDADSDVRRGALSALGSLGWPSDEGMQRGCFEVVLKACEDADRFVRRDALSALVRLGWPSDEGMQRRCVEVVLKACEDADRAVRRGALSALVRLDWPSDKGMQRRCFEVVLKACGDEDWAMRRAALSALGSLGWPSDEGMQRGCVEFWLKACEDEGSFVRRGALSALGSLGWPSDEGMQRRCVEVVLKACEDADSNVRDGALYALKRLGWPSDEGMQRGCVEFWLKACGDAGSNVRCGALSALGRLGWPSEEGMQRRCVEVVLKACEDADRAVRRGALYALEGLGWPSDEGMQRRCFEVVLKACGDAGSNVLWDALSVLRDLGRPSDEVMQRGCFEVVLKACEDADSNVRHGALYALGRLGWPSDEGMQRGCFEVVLKACEDADSDVRRGALSALERLGWPSDLASSKLFINFLLQARKNEDWITKNAAQKILDKLTLTKLLEQKDFLNNRDYCQIIRDKAIVLNTAMYFQDNEDGTYTIQYYEHNRLQQLTDESSKSIVISEETKSIMYEVFAEFNPLLVAKPKQENTPVVSPFSQASSPTLFAMTSVGSHISSLSPSPTSDSNWNIDPSNSTGANLAASMSNSVLSSSVSPPLPVANVPADSTDVQIPEATSRSSSSSSTVSSSLSSSYS